MAAPTSATANTEEGLAAAAETSAFLAQLDCIDDDKHYGEDKLAKLIRAWLGITYEAENLSASIASAVVESMAAVLGKNTEGFANTVFDSLQETTSRTRWSMQWLQWRLRPQ